MFGQKVREENGGKSFHLKGVVPIAARDVITDLVALHGVPATKVVGALRCMGEAMGFEVEGKVSERSIGRIMLEGGAASEVQFVRAVHEGEGLTISGDGTSHKNVNFESHHATVVDKEGRKKQFFLNIAMAVNHTSETQLKGWTDLVEQLYEVGRDFLEDGTDDGAREWREFWNKLTGMMSDHAEDQKKLFRLLREYKKRIEREGRGERFVHNILGANGMDICLSSISNKLVQQSGGVEAWEVLAPEERAERLAEGRRTFFRQVGEASFDALPAEAKTDVDFMLWAGCCMHKEMNAFKGFCAGMEGWWGESGQDGPIKLYNRDNAVAAKSAQGTSAAKRAEERTKGGAVKLVSLAGAIFRHKDRKRGQQDTLRFFFDVELGFIISFPDTSNTRFQSHAEACTVVLTYLDLFIQFLEYVRDSKASEKLNHMEKNVLDALRCRKTIREVVLIVLYSQAISIPYMREIRGPFRSYDSVLDQAPLHRKVITHLEKIATHPELLISASLDSTVSAVDGKQWSAPDAVYAACTWIQRCSEQEKNDMKCQLTAACTSAIDTWRRFSTEFEQVEEASQKNIRRAPMANTNDANEAAFAGARRTWRSNPSMSAAQLSARKAYRDNGTSEFLSDMSPAQRAILRKRVRRRDASGANRAAKQAQIVHLKATAAETRRRREARKVKQKLAMEKIQSTTVITSIAKLDEAVSKGPREEGYMTVQLLDEQLNWHQSQWPDGPLPKTKKERGDRAKKIDYLRTAIAYHSLRMAAIQAAGASGGEGGSQDLEDVEMGGDEDSLMDVDCEDDEDSEAEFYDRSRTW
ncbi:hypothetical protein EV122DRAFT_224505 [Schizophyllum commune]